MTEHRYLLTSCPVFEPTPPEVVHAWRGDRNRGTMTCARCGAVPGGWLGAMPCGSDPADPKWGMNKGTRAEATR